MILASIEEQGKLTDELRAAVDAAATKQALEDIYLPYKPKRRTRAQIAREAGLEPLADALLADPTLDPQARKRRKYVNEQTGGGKWRSRRESRARWRARYSIRAFCRNAELLANCAAGCGNRALFPPKWRKGKKPPKMKNSGTTTTIPKRYARSRRIARSRCSAVKAWRC